MSYPAIGRVLASGLTDSTEVAVLVAIAYHLNEKTGFCYPSVSAISRVARRSPNFVRKAIKALEAKGLISCQQVPGGVRHFMLHLDLLPLSESQPLANQEPLTNSKPLSESQVPPCETVTPPLSESEGDPLRNRKPNKEDNREVNKEQNKVICAPVARAPAAQPKKRPAITHPLHITDLPDQWRDYCAQVRPDLDPDRVWTAFRFYWTSGRGSGTRRSDKSWNSTWQTWVRREDEARSPAHQETPEEFGKRIAREMQEEEEMRRRNANAAL